MENKRQLIYVDDAKRAIEHYDPAFACVIDNVPTVDAVEVVHGRWKRTPISGTLFCSACDKIPEFQIETTYCPNCGAKMDGGIKQ